MSVAPKVAVVGQGSDRLLDGVGSFGEVPVRQGDRVRGARLQERRVPTGRPASSGFDKLEAKEWARHSFTRFAQLERRFGPSTGIKMVSGHIQSDKRELLEGQEANYAGHRLQLPLAFGSRAGADVRQSVQGRKYVPFLVDQLKEKGASFEQKEFGSLLDVNRAGFDFVFNCARALTAARSRATTTRWFPFNYRDFTTFTIPMSNSVTLGTLKQIGRYDTEITEEDRKGHLGALPEAPSPLRGREGPLPSGWPSDPSGSTSAWNIRRRRPTGRSSTWSTTTATEGTGSRSLGGVRLDAVQKMEPHFR
ncbi:FAD dependent oxidoreductase [Aphelenchoides fujianensis]|nr:FAD dependent oxidoreductase [Aphelenchoides fujianensis]